MKNHRPHGAAAIDLWFGVLLVLIFAGPLAAGSVTLVTPTVRSIGTLPFGVANGDFNGDGKLDCAAANFGGNNVSIIFGDGTGNFSAPVFIPVGQGPHQLLSVDYNHDAKLDLIVVNTTSNNFTILINDGSGNFSGTSYPSGFGPTSITAGDFNGDSRLDIATSNEQSSTAYISIANASTGFDPPVQRQLVHGKPKYITSGDTDGDNKLDLLIVNADTSSISVIQNEGMGTFGSYNVYYPGDNSVPNQVVLCNFNGDAYPDMIAPLMVANKVAFFAGTANGMFSFVTSFSLTAGDVPVSVVARDINGDSKTDLVTTCYNSDLVRILYGDGVGGISSQSSMLVAKTPHETAVGDFNGDGLMDLNTIHDTGGTLSVMLNRGPTGFVSAKLLDPSTGPIRIADFNGDGNHDLLLNSSRIILGNGNGTFASPVTQPGGFVGLDVVVGDINNDGKLDYVTSGSGGFTAHINSGSGSFPGPINVSTTGGQIGLGDFNGDGKVDVLVAYASDIAQNIRFFQGDGAGNFVLNGAATLPRGTTTLAVADLDHDNKPDLVVHQGATGSFNPRTAILIGNGPFTFAPPAFYEFNACSALNPEISGSDGGSVIPIADFNRDGHLDVMRGGTCSLLLGNGTGSFTSVASPNLTGQPGDLDRNGVVDLANSAFNVGEVRLSFNDGTGTQFSTTSYAAGRAGDSVLGGVVRLGDFNNDGVADVLFVNPNPVSSVSGTWLMLSKNLARGLVTADFDGDGITDISVFRPSNGTWHIIRSSTNTFYSAEFGLNGDRPVPGDYDGDGKTDLAVFRDGDWHMLRSSDGAFATVHHGSPGDIPVPADYDGDGLTNIAVFRPSNATWYTSTNPATNYGAVQWGVSTDTPAPADFDGDGRADVAVFRPIGGIWYVLGTSSGFVQQQFGSSSDRLVPVDFDGDGRANFGVFRPSSGYWYTSTNPATNFGGVQWGAPSDIPAPGYFDGDNKADLTVYRNGAWYVLYSNSASYSLFNFGVTGDIPIPSAYYPQ